MKMPWACSIPGCPTGRTVLRKNISMFTIPKDFILQKKWLSAIAIHCKSFKIKPHQAICERHFQPHEITRIVAKYEHEMIKTELPLGRAKLVKGAVPSQFFISNKTCSRYRNIFPKRIYPVPQPPKPTEVVIIEEQPLITYLQDAVLQPNSDPFYEFGNSKPIKREAKEELQEATVELNSDKV